MHRDILGGSRATRGHGMWPLCFISSIHRVVETVFDRTGLPESIIVYCKALGAIMRA